MQGWIKDYRKEVISDIWMMPPIYHRVWQYLKYDVNHKEKTIPTKNGKLTLKKGQTVTSYQRIAEGVSWYEWGVKRTPNKKTVKDILDWLEKAEMIARESNAKGTLITVCNYCEYQGAENGESNAVVTQEKRLLDTNKNVKNGKNEKNESIKIFVEAEDEEMEPQHDSGEKGKEKKKPSSSKVFADDSPEMSLAKKLKGLILRNNPNARTPSDLQKWSGDIDRMMRIDKREYLEINRIIEFSQYDDFWMTNILSASKLRAQYDKLYLQMKKRGKAETDRKVVEF